THHNVGGLPETMKLKLIEPLKDLFKDEVRSIGKQLDMPDEILQRQPFPGPGLAVRILGEVTRERIALLQEADDIVGSEVRRAGLYTQIWQSFAVLLPVMSVGVMGDQRTYAYTCAIRAVHSEDGMTADWVPLPYDVLKRISNRIVNEVRGINRVVYDVTSKPPGKIEGEKKSREGKTSGAKPPSPLNDELNEIRRRVESLVRDLTPEQIMRRPDPAKWSIAECLAHLNITAAVVQRFMAQG